MEHDRSFWAVEFCVIHQNIQLEGTMLCDWNAFIQYQFCEGKDSSISNPHYLQMHLLILQAQQK